MARTFTCQFLYWINKIVGLEDSKLKHPEHATPPYIEENIKLKNQRMEASKNLRQPARTEPEPGTAWKKPDQARRLPQQTHTVLGPVMASTAKPMHVLNRKLV